MDNISKLLGEKVKLLRKQQGISQEKLAAMSNLSRSAFGSIERGEWSPTVDTVASIAKALDVDLYKIFMFD